MISSFSKVIQSMSVPTPVKKEPEDSPVKPVENKAEQAEDNIDQPVLNEEKGKITVEKKSEPKIKTTDKKDNIKKTSQPSSKKEERTSVSEESIAEKEEKYITGYKIQSDFIIYIKVKAVQNNQSIMDYFNGLLSSYIDSNTINVADIMRENKKFKDKEAFSVPITLSNRDKLKDIGGKYGIKSSIFINYMLYKTIQEDKNNPLNM